jgi:putative FmdB family regulatory protein
MPIYPYLCGSCGHHQDVLQKMSDSALTKCTQCGEETFSKQLSAPAFQLKGSGWYVTDFRENGKKPEVPEGAKDDSAKSPEKSAETSADKSVDKPADKAATQSATKSDDKTAAKPAADAVKTTATAAPAPAAATSKSTPKAPPASS